MAMSGLFGRNNLTDLRIDLGLPEEIFADCPTLGRVRVTNRRRWLPGFLLEVELAGRRVLFPLVPAGASVERPVELRFSRRGEHPLPELSLTSSFPVNFFRRGFRFRPPGTGLVFPHPVAFANPVDHREPSGVGVDPVQWSGQEGELRSISDYQGGEPLKAIHWKLSARQDELKVKWHSGLSEPPVLIELHQLPGPLEQQLSHASHLVLELTRNHRPVGLKLAGMSISAGSGSLHRRKLLKELARYAEG